MTTFKDNGVSSKRSGKLKFISVGALCDNMDFVLNTSAVAAAHLSWDAGSSSSLYGNVVGGEP